MTGSGDQKGSTVLGNAYHFSIWWKLFSDDLRGIAGEKIVRGRPKYEEEFDDEPGVYIFTSLTHGAVLKVGQSIDIRQRVGIDHLRTRDRLLSATIRDYYSRQAGEWPGHLLYDQVTLCVFYMRNSTERFRKSAEMWLQEKVGHVLP